MKIADLYCGAGGAGMGLHRAGFEVVGFDIEPQPNYPFEFHQSDALNVDLSGFDAIWASPPCQAYSNLRKLNESLGRFKHYPELVEQTRTVLVASGLPYVIENVPGSPLIDPVRICGSSFGLRIRRHRLFESNITLWPLPCSHHWQKPDLPGLHRSQGNSTVVGVYGGGRRGGDNLALRSQVMGIDWMSRQELNQAIPPAYSELIGKQIIQHMGYERA